MSARRKRPPPHHPSREGRALEHPPVRKSLGQHFLTDRAILARIADALELRGDETVVEIGAGRGALTEQLLERAGRIVAIELDRLLAAALRSRFAEEPRLRVIEADVLDVPLAVAAGGPFVLVGNVPYYITTPIIFHALRRPRPSRAVFLVQREVAERMSAAPGGRAYGALSVNLQALVQVETLFRVAAGSFSPPPKVDSAVIRLTPLGEPAIDESLEEAYRSLVVGAFGLRRKQMRRVVRTLAHLDANTGEETLRQAGIDPDARPETITPRQFAELVKLLQQDR
ncbi:MAG: 16S rRNA (adenine(1518)-N(6)/adenine(1519)-N(6))-dimethyltransferase RsmA [Gemmatimonadaceae bacterium]